MLKRIIFVSIVFFGVVFYTAYAMEQESQKKVEQADNGELVIKNIKMFKELLCDALFDIAKNAEKELSEKEIKERKIYTTLLSSGELMDKSGWFQGFCENMDKRLPLITGKWTEEIIKLTAIHTLSFKQLTFFDDRLTAYANVAQDELKTDLQELSDKKTTDTEDLKDDSDNDSMYVNLGDES